MRAGMLLFAVLMGCVNTAGTRAQDVTLLFAVRDLRASTHATAFSGRGTAEVHGLHAARGVGTDMSGKPGHFNFTFSGDKYVARESDPANKEAFVYQVYGNGDKVCEFVNVRGRTPFIQIASPTTRRYGLQLEPRGWSIPAMDEIPMFARDSDFFDFITRADKSQYVVKAERNGELVRSALDSIVDGHTHRSAEHLIIEFDMSMGGAIVAYTYENISVKADPIRKEAATHITKERLDMVWVRVKDHIVPRSRKVLIQHIVDGKVTEDHASTIRFENMKFEPIAPDEFSLAALKPPVSTPVNDEIRHVQWRYFNGATDQGRSPATGPAGSEVK